MTLNINRVDSFDFEELRFVAMLSAWQNRLKVFDWCAKFDRRRRIGEVCIKGTRRGHTVTIRTPIYMRTA